MNDNSLVGARAEAVECALSLAKAVYDAGGAFASINLNEMTVMEFITEVAAQNNIRFVYVGPQPVMVNDGSYNTNQSAIHADARRKSRPGPVG